MITLQHVAKTYKMGATSVHALRDINLSINDGEYIAIIGPSGSGKSTLMNILGCLDTPSSGEYVLNGARVSKLGDDQLATVRNRQIGFVFQQFNLLPRATAFRNVELPLRYGGIGGRKRKDRSAAVLTAVGLGERMHHKPSELSGGQQQRVAIARALVTQASVLLADEPTGALDSKTGAEILALFEQLQRDRGITIILVTHDPAVARHARRIISIRDGTIETDHVLALADRSSP